jgi:hypothetical protein
MLTSKVDPTLWKMELERVGPKLRILLNADAKDWRTNLEEVHTNSKVSRDELGGGERRRGEKTGGEEEAQLPGDCLERMVAHSPPHSRPLIPLTHDVPAPPASSLPQAISTAWPESRGVLEKLRTELNNSLEKLTTREKFLNEQFERLMQQYRAQREQLQSAQVRGGWMHDWVEGKGGSQEEAR